MRPPFLFSFGVNERLNQETNQLMGHSMPVCLWQREEEPSTEEKELFEGMNNIFNGHFTRKIELTN